MCIRDRIQVRFDTRNQKEATTKMLINHSFNNNALRSGEYGEIVSTENTSETSTV